MHIAWHQRSLDENLQKLTKVIPVLNFLAHPIASVESVLCNNLTSHVQNELAEAQLDHVEAHRSQRNTNSFIIGCQRHRPDAITLLANLTCSSWLCVKYNHQAQNCPLLVKFFMDFADVLHPRYLANGTTNTKQVSLCLSTSTSS